MPTRQPELENRIFCNSEEEPYEGQMFLVIPNPEYTVGSIDTEIWFEKGKIHGKPAIIYPDGLSEIWEHGKFVDIYDLPYSQRT